MSEEADIVPFVGRFATQSTISDIANDIRNNIGLDNSLRRGAESRDTFFSQLAEHSEKVGVIVMRSGIVGSNTQGRLGPDEFQGFGISDSIALLIFINQNDFKSAQVFTFAHELAHIWMGLSGVPSIEFLSRASEQAHPDKSITDAVGAEMLVPAENFESRWYRLANIDRNLDRLSRHYKVSMFIILRRAFELLIFNGDTFYGKYQELAERVPKRTRGGG